LKEKFYWTTVKPTVVYGRCSGDEDVDLDVWLDQRR